MRWWRACGAPRHTLVDGLSCREFREMDETNPERCILQFAIYRVRKFRTSSIVEMPRRLRDSMAVL